VAEFPVRDSGDLGGCGDCDADAGRDDDCGVHDADGGVVFLGMRVGDCGGKEEEEEAPERKCARIAPPP